MLLVRYRGGMGMLAWALNRLTGVGLWAFIVLHVVDIYLAGWKPELYNEVLAIYKSPPGRLAEIALAGALLYHALNGLRIVIMDFWPATTKYHRQLWLGVWAVTALVMPPLSFIIFLPVLRDWFGIGI